MEMRQQSQQAFFKETNGKFKVDHESKQREESGEDDELILQFKDDEESEIGTGDNNKTDQTSHTNQPLNQNPQMAKTPQKQIPKQVPRNMVYKQGGYQQSFQQKIESRIEQWQIRKNMMANQKNDRITNNILQNQYDVAFSPPGSLNTNYRYSQEQLNPSFNKYQQYIVNKPQPFYYQPQRKSQNEFYQNSYQGEISMDFQVKQRSEHRQERERQSQMAIPDEVFLEKQTLEDMIEDINEGIPQGDIYQKNEINKMKIGDVEDDIEEFNIKKENVYDFRTKDNQLNQDLNIVNQLLNPSKAMNIDPKGRIPISQFIEQSNSNSIQQQTQKKSTYLFSSNLKQKDSVATSGGHDQEIIHTKDILRKAKRFQLSKITTQVVKIKRIMKRILSLVQIKRLFQRNYQLSSLQYDLISDNSYFHSESDFQQENIVMKHFQFLATHLNKPLQLIKRIISQKIFYFLIGTIIRPESGINLAWMILQLLTYSVFLSVVSITIFFSDEILSDDGFEANLWLRLFNVIFIFIMTILDIIKELNCGYYECGEVIVDRVKISQKYLRSSRFKFDILACFSILTEIFQPSVKYDVKIIFKLIKLLIFFKLSLITDIMKKIESQFLFSNLWNNWIHLIKLIIIVLFTCHIMAIVYYGQALLQVNYLDAKNTWLNMANLLEESSPVMRYIQSLYNATCLMVAAIQYNPKEPYEAIFVTLATIGNTVFFGFIVNAIGSILDDFGKNSQDYRKEIATINQFMNQTNIPKDLQIRVRNYLQYNHKYQKKVFDSNEANEILTKLPLKIKNQVVSVVNSSYLSDIPIINETFSSNFIQQILMKMEQVKFIPGDSIFKIIEKNFYLKENKKDDMSIYLILEGKVDLYLQNRSGKDRRDKSDYVFKELNKGQYFGEYSFFTGMSRSASAKSSSYCTLAKIKREDFLLSLAYFHEDMERFKEKLDYLILYSNYNAINMSCYLCQSSSHLVKDCKSVHISPYHHTIINAYNRRIDQDRNDLILRNDKCRFNARENMHSLIASAIVIVENYSDIIDNLGSRKKAINFQFKQTNYQQSPISQPESPNMEPQQINIDQIEEVQEDIQQDQEHLQPDQEDKSDQASDRNRSYEFKQNSPVILGKHSNRVSMKPLLLVKQKSNNFNGSLNAFSLYEPSLSIPKGEEIMENDYQSRLTIQEKNDQFNNLRKSGEQLHFVPQMIQCQSEMVKKSIHQQDILQKQIANVSKIKQQVEYRKYGLQLKSKTNFEQTPRIQNSAQIDFSSLMDSLKNYTYYFPEDNFQNVIKSLISKKVIHTNKINLLIAQVNKIKQTKQKNIIKIRLYQQELKKKNKNTTKIESLKNQMKSKSTQKSRFSSKSFKK